MRRRDRTLLLAGYALATFLSFPHPIGGRVVDLGLAMVWLGPGLLLLGIDGLTPRRAAAAAFLAGLAAHASILHWIYIVTVVYGHAPMLAGYLAPLALASYIAAFPAAFGACWSLLARARLASPLAAALLWTALDHARSFALSGFPWATLGYAQHANAALMALAPFTGVYGLSFASALGGAGIARALHDRRAGRPASRAPWAAFAALVAAHGLGLVLIRAPEPDLPTLRVGVLQGNIDQGVKWSRSWVQRTLEIYEDLTRRAAADGAAVILWPETALPGSLETDPDLRERIAALSRETGAVLVVGAVGIDLDAANGRPLRYFDSAYLVDPSAGFLERYDKSHLVPFGEYVPLRDLIGLFVRSVASGIASSDVSAGPGPRSIALQVHGSPERQLTVGVPICYELLFPGLVRRFVRGGAEVLFAITNDAWYGRTGAPYQFLAITAVRSAETRVWTARAANTGVSAFIDARGRVRARTPIFERAVLVHDVPLRPAPAGGSFYARRGDVFAGVCWMGTLGLVVAAARRRRPVSG